MTSYATGWLMALVFISVPLAALLLVWSVARRPLVHCPETGGIGLVELELAGPGEPTAPRIRRCDLWPERAGCAQGCLAGHPEEATRYGVVLDALVVSRARSGPRDGRLQSPNSST